MARRRLFSLDIVDTDAFLEMPGSTQALYFHLGMRADDDGFVSNPRKITVLVNASTDDFKLLITKGFVIPFKSGVCVIRDWRIHNTIQKDRYKPTLYQTEKQMLQTVNNQYFLMDTKCIQGVSIMETQDKLSKDKLREDKRRETDIIKAGKPPNKKFVPPSLDDVKAYAKERDSVVDAEYFIDFYASKGWKVGRETMKDWKAAFRRAEKWDCWGKISKPDIKDAQSYKTDESEGFYFDC